MTIRKMTVNEAQAASVERCCPLTPSKKKTIMVVASLLALTLFGGLLGFFVGRSESKRWHSEPPDPEDPLPPSPSKLHIFQNGAVCTDAPKCSQIGRDILLKNGSAVDAAIAALFCNGLLNQQSMGIGGGFFMTVYNKAENTAYAIDARETAPAAAKTDMFHGSEALASKGPLAVGVPGEVRGYWAAWQRWGKLPWRTLVAPAIELCTYGYPMSPVLYDALETAPQVQKDAHLREQYYNTITGQFRKPGTIVKPSAAFCNTLRIISERGGDELYNGSLARDFLDDLTTVGSIISEEDLRNYQPKITKPLQVHMGQGDIIYTPPPPSSGIILINILNILSAYNFTRDSISTTNETILTYHRIIEAFKHAYATRTKLGDPDFLDLKELIARVSSPEYGPEVRKNISDYHTSNNTDDYGASVYQKPDSGTAHISIIGTNGDAVSVTSSVNFYFGAGFTTLKTGIVMNNVMDDFSSPGIINYHGVAPSEANFIEPGKKPLSSMAPSIIVDRNGNAKMVIGASGGPKITTAVALVAMRKLWFGQSIKEAVDAARLHHQLLPMQIEYEYGITKDIIEGLRAKGHGTERYKGRGSIVCAMYRNSTAIYANADFRKGGDVSGIDEHTN